MEKYMHNDMNKNGNYRESCKTFLIHALVFTEYLSKLWVFITFDEIKVFVRVSYILIRNILIWVECYLI